MWTYCRRTRTYTSLRCNTKLQWYLYILPFCPFFPFPLSLCPFVPLSSCPSVIYDPNQNPLTTLLTIPFTLYALCDTPDLQNVTIHTILDGVKFSGVWVTEPKIFCCKFNLFSQFCICGGKSSGKCGNITFNVFLVSWYCILRVFRRCLVHFIVFCCLCCFVPDLVLPKITHFLG